MRTGTYRYLSQERVTYGRPAAAAVLEETAQRGCSRVLVVTGRSVAHGTPVVRAVAEALGERLAGIFDACVEHTPRATVVALAGHARETHADLLVAVGGGSTIDAAKMALLCLAAEVQDEEALDDWHVRLDPAGGRIVPAVGRPPIRQIAVPTTLSGAEFSDLAGCLDGRRRIKHLFTAAGIEPAAVVLDPAVTLHTPERLWLSTGIRAVDHAIESVCSTEAQPLVDAACLAGLELLGRSLVVNGTEPDRLDARLDSQLGMWLACTGVNRVAFGASHGIGHVLGAAGMPHGMTSCVMLPAVMRFNAPVTGSAQARIAAALGAKEAAEGVAGLVAALGLPGRLREFGLDRAAFPDLAEKALANPLVRSNPRRIDRAEQVIDILDDAW